VLRRTVFGLLAVPMIVPASSLMRLSVRNLMLPAKDDDTSANFALIICEHKHAIERLLPDQVVNQMRRSQIHDKIGRLFLPETQDDLMVLRQLRTANVA
jgi:hypothetical protein